MTNLVARLFFMLLTVGVACLAIAVFKTQRSLPLAAGRSVGESERGLVRNAGNQS